MQVTDDVKNVSHASNDGHNMHVFYPRSFSIAIIRIVHNPLQSFPGFQS